MKSMGSQVEMDRCSICGRESYTHVHTEQLMARDIPASEFTLSPTFLPASLVPAPKCGSCGNEMAAHEGRDWVCTTDDCQADGFVVPAHLLGVFPSTLLP